MNYADLLFGDQQLDRGLATQALLRGESPTTVSTSISPRQTFKADPFRNAPQAPQTPQRGQGLPRATQTQPESRQGPSGAFSGDPLTSQYQRLSQERADLQGQYDKLFEPVDYTTMQDYAKQRSAQGQRQLLMALAAAHGGETTKPIGAMFLKQAQEAMNPIKTKLGYITPAGERIDDPDAQRDWQTARIENRLKQNETLMNSNISLQEKSRLAQESNQLKMMIAGMAAANRSGNSDLDRQLKELRIEQERAKLNAPPKLSATSEKELYEADDTARASANAIGNLTRALSLNDSSFSGFGAKERATVASNLGYNKEQANNTLEFSQLVGSQALESLRAIFGGNPTEGERKILLDLQAAPGLPAPARKVILQNAINAAQARMDAAIAKGQGIRSGSYTRTQPDVTVPTVGGAASAGGLSAAEQAELDQLRLKHGRK